MLIISCVWPVVIGYLYVVEVNVLCSLCVSICMQYMSVDMKINVCTETAAPLWFSSIILHHGQYVAGITEMVLR